jgi:hypothetical protein
MNAPQIHLNSAAARADQWSQILHFAATVALVLTMTGGALVIARAAIANAIGMPAVLDQAAERGGM